MKQLKIWIIPLLTALVAVLILATYFKDTDAQSTPPPSSPALTFSVSSDAAVPTLQRLGMNMSFRNPFGAEQYMRNILQNPGFEGQINRILVIVQQTDKTSFSDNQGLGQTDGFWKEATFEVRSGQSVGVTGTISNSLNSGANGLPQYFTEGAPPALALNDVVAITLVQEPNPVAMWWISNSSASTVTVDTSNARPGSTGSCSMLFAPTAQNTSADLDSYIDTLQGPAGNLLEVSGPWNLTFWIKGDGQGGNLAVSFARSNGSPAYFSQTVTAPNDWQQMTFNFNATDTGSPIGIKFSMAAVTPGTKIWVDDINLGPVQSSNPLTAWRQDVIDMLKEINPSFIRDWQGQLPDTFANRISDEYGRKVAAVRLYGGAGNFVYFYSIPEIFDLCTQVGANPWLTIPSTLSDSELDAFGTYIGQNATTAKFSEIALEFGNENWNSLFRSEGIPVPSAHGLVSDRAFQRISAAAGSNVNIKKVINAQYVNPSYTLQIAEASQDSNVLSVAPYFFDSMATGSSNSQNTTGLFADDSQYMKQIQQGMPSSKSLAIYEINIGTTQGTATGAERLPIVAGTVSGVALAKSIIQKLAMNVQPQNIFCFAQYNENLWDITGTANLLGVCRDCSPTKRWRPTGLATIMLNQVIGGSLHTMTAVPPQTGSVPPASNNITAAAFRSASSWAAAVVSVNDAAQNVVIQFPNDGVALPSAMKVLNSATPYDTNEDSENVTIQDQDIQVNNRDISFSVPAYGFVILTAGTATQQPTAPSPTKKKKKRKKSTAFAATDEQDTVSMDEMDDSDEEENDPSNPDMVGL